MRPLRRSAALALVLLLLASCASTAIGRGIEAASIQKQLVQAAMVEVIKLQLTGKITNADYQTAVGAYSKWSMGEAILANAIAEWQTVKSQDNTTKLNDNLSAVAALSTQFLAFVGQFVNIPFLQTKIKGS